MSDFIDRNSLSAFVWPTVINLGFVFVMWGVTVMPGGLADLAYSLHGSRDLGSGLVAADIGKFFKNMAEAASPVTWAFLGSYFYTLTVLVRRWFKSDLTTGLLWKINVRIAVSLIVGLLLLMIGQLGQTDSLIAPSFVAFIAGIIPDSVLRWLNQQSKRIVNLEGEDIGRLFEPSDLQKKIDGLNFWQADRMSEEGIESIYDLAMTEIPNLLISTRFDTPRVLYWVDQALLCNQVGDQVEMYKNAYIRTASDLLELVHKNGIKSVCQSISDAQFVVNQNSPPSGDDGHLDNKITPLMIRNANITLESGPNLAYLLEYWKNTSTIDAREKRISALKKSDLFLDEKTSH